MSRPDTFGFQKPLRPQKMGRARRATKPKPVGMAIISYVGPGAAACSCEGWTYRHQREKVLEDAIDKHLNKKHGGFGIRM